MLTVPGIITFDRLLNRQYTVYFGSHFGNHTINQGVPQGSTLGHALLVLNINNFQDRSKFVSVRFVHKDDTGKSSYNR